LGRSNNKLPNQAKPALTTHPHSPLSHQALRFLSHPDKAALTLQDIACVCDTLNMQQIYRCVCACVCGGGIQLKPSLRGAATSLRGAAT